MNTSSDKMIGRLPMPVAFAGVLLVLLTGLRLIWPKPLAAQDNCRPATGTLLYQDYDRSGWLGVTLDDVDACISELKSASALVSAIQHVQDPRIVFFLVGLGADLHQGGVGNPNRIDMLFAALARTDNPSVVLGIVEVLLDARWDLSEADYLHQALEGHSDHVALIQLLLSRGADANKPGNLSLTPLHVAARNTGNPAVIRTLIDYGANANTQTISYFAEPPLHDAIDRCNLGLVSAFLEGGADPNGMNDSDPIYTPLEYTEVRCSGSAEAGIMDALRAAGARER